MSRITRWYDMTLWKVNVPDFIRNCGRVFNPHVLAFTKEMFTHVDKVMLLSERDEVEQWYRRVSVQWAVQVSIQLEKYGHTVLIAEDPDVEYNGKIWIYQDGSGFYQIEQDKKTWFPDYARLENLKLRYVVRLLHDFLLKIRCPGVMVDFAWAKETAGLWGNRYLVYDFMPVAK